MYDWNVGDIMIGVWETCTVLWECGGHVNVHKILTTQMSITPLVF